MKREKAASETGNSTVEVGFDVRRRKVTQGAWKNAGKAIMASNNLQKIKALSKNAAEPEGAGEGSEPATMAAGLSRGRTVSGNLVRNDSGTVAQVAALSLLPVPAPASAQPQDVPTPVNT